MANGVFVTFCGNFCGKKKPLLNPFFITFFLKKSIYISILPQCHKVFKSCRNSDLNIGKSFWFVAMWFCVRTFTNLPELSRVVTFIYKFSSGCYRSGWLGLAGLGWWIGVAGCVKFKLTRVGLVGIVVYLVNVKK